MRRLAQFLIGFFVLTGITTCSLPPPEPYLLRNPLLAAYRHEINLDTLKFRIAEDSLVNVEQKEGGYLLYSEGYVADIDFWINDSLLIARQLNNYYHSWPDRSSLGERALIEAAFRKTNKNLTGDLIQVLTQDGPFGFLDQAQSYQYEPVRIPQTIFVDINESGLVPIDTFVWKSTVFDTPAEYHFLNGKLHGAYHSVDSNGLAINGYFRDGLETGIWEYKDSLGRLQYMEEYQEGEIQKAVQQRGATYQRSAPLPTLSKLSSIHRVVTFLIGVLGVFLLFKYVQQLKKFNNPYKGKSTWENLGLVLIMPFTAILSGLIVLIAATLSNQIMPILGWDLSVDFMVNLVPLIFFIFFEFIFLLITTRFKDLIWHVVIMFLIILLLEEFSFLRRLAVYL